MTEEMLPAEVVEATRRREEYRSNARHALDAREYAKAAELTWGAVTQEWIRSAFFLKHELIGQHHAQFRQLCEEIGQFATDKFYVDAYNDLNQLHSFFYRDVVLAAPEVTVPQLMHLADEMIDRLEGFIAAKLGKPAQP